MHQTRCLHVIGWFFLAASLRAERVAGEPIDLQLARRYFDEAKALSERDGGRLWGKGLYGPLMFADPTTRTLVADRADPEGKLRADGGVFVGTLPADQNIANTSFTWSGVKWTMVVWPPPGDALDRGMLLMHELWHRVQDDIGFPSTGPSNAHLDSHDGRVWIRLEWSALRKAVQSKEAVRRAAIGDALTFRAYRRTLFSQATDEERSLEMHEGLANYTGAALAGADEAERVACAVRALESGESKPTYVRSFAYASGPVYGLLLDALAPNWRHGLSPKQDLGELLSKAIGFASSTDLATAAKQRSTGYDNRVFFEEAAREQKRQERFAAMKSKLVDGPVFRLPFRQMKIQLNPDEVVALGELGTVYPTARIVDAWGVLSVTDGALIDKNWLGVTVAAPPDSTARPLSGPGWTLELGGGWIVAPGPRAGDFQLGPGGDNK